MSLTSASRAQRAKRAAGMALLIMGCTLLFTLTSGGSKRANQIIPSDKALQGILSSSKLLDWRQSTKSSRQLSPQWALLAEESEEEGEGEGEGGSGEGGEEGGEKSEEEEVAEAAVKTRWGFAFVTIIIVFSVGFEYAVDVIREAVPEDLQEVVAALLEELTTLGFLGFAFFITTVPIGGEESLIERASMYSLHEPEALEELFEGLHYLVFFVSLSFIICTILGLYHFHWTGNAAWKKYEESGLELLNQFQVSGEEGIKDMRNLIEIDHQYMNPEGSLMKEWNKPDEVAQAEYIRIRSRFILESEDPKLNADFPFHTYLQKRASEIFSSMIKITAVDWLATWLLLSLFFGVVQEGVTADRLLALYWFLLVMITALCLLLQAKMVWVKQQLIPRVPSELQSSANRTDKLVTDPVYKDQSTFVSSSYIPKETPQAIKDFFKHALNYRIGTKQERLFWFSSLGPTVMSHLIRLSMFWCIISLAMLLSHHMPGVVHLGVELCGLKWVGWVIFATIVVLHGVAITIIYVTARVFTLCTSIEMLQDEEMVTQVVREQKYEKCQKAIEMLFTLHFYMQQMKFVQQQAQGVTDEKKKASETPRSTVFEAKTEEEKKAMEELSQLFSLYDHDNSGELSPEEVGELLGTMGVKLQPAELANLIKLMDKDESGAISLEELAGVMLSKKQMGKDVKLSEVGEEMFKIFDADGEGEISLEEMMQTFEKFGWDCTEVNNFFEVLDSDKSGNVDYDEFMTFIADVEALAK